jgi:hypothetical protein
MIPEAAHGSGAGMSLGGHLEAVGCRGSMIIAQARTDSDGNGEK